MGSDVTPSSNLTGLLLPWALTHTPAIGTSYDCADTRPGAFSVSGRTPLRMEPSLPPGVTYPASVTQIQVQAIRAGAAGATRASSSTGPAAGVAYKVNGAGDWYGRDDAHTQTGGVRRVVSEVTAGISQPSMVGLANGKIVVCYTTAAATLAAVRAADGTWTTGITVTGGNVGAISCICAAPDGALHIYAARPVSTDATPRWVIACYRSADDGATWWPVAFDVGITSVSSAEKGTWTRIRAGSVNGAVALFLNTTTAGPVYNVQQYVSTDGGFAFRRVLDETAGHTVWDLVPSLGTLHVVTTDSTTLNHRALSNPVGSILSTDATQIGSTSPIGTDPAAITADEAGTLYVQIANLSDPVYGLDAYRSADNGATWNDSGPNVTLNSASEKPTMPALAFSRGTLVGLFCNNTTARGMYEARWGGNTNATIGSQISGRTSELQGYLPFAKIGDCGFTETLVGTPTITLNVDGSGNTATKVVTGAGESWLYTSPATTTTSAGIASVVIRVAAVGGGNPGIVVFTANDTATHIDITTTQIRAYDSGGTPSAYVNHGAATTDYIEILCISDPQHSQSFVAFRVLDNTAERTFTSLPAVTGQASTGGTDLLVKIAGDENSTIYINRVTRAKANALTLGSGWESPRARPYSLDPVPLSISPTHLTNGIDVTMTAGIAVVDQVTQTSVPDATRRASNVLPNVAPSPRATWRSSSTSNQTLTFTVPARDRCALVGIYADALYGIGSLDVTCGLGSATVDLTTTIRYRALGGNAVIPSTTGSTTQRPWVRADELVGWRFKDASGTIRTVTGNSEGSLTYGSTIAEHRAAIYLDGATDAATNSTGTLYPSRALLLGYLAADGTDDVTGLTVSIPSAANSGIGDYREIGTLAAGRVHIFGETPDLGDTLAMESAANVQTMADGQRYASRRMNDRRSLEIAFADSTHEARAMFGSSTSPDYVIVTTGAKPAASRTGIPLVVEGIVRRAAAQSNGLAVFVPSIARQSSAGWVAQTFGLDSTIYGRIVSSFRREAVPYVGSRSVSQVFRVPTIRIEEEL